ncbi:hypothetical protein ACFL04_04220 [Patescibacteria group bacterium]
MSLKKYLISISVSTLLAWLSWVTVLFYIDPEAGWLAHVLFHGALFLAIMGTFSVIGFYVRAKIYHEIALFKHVGISFRQAAWLSLFSIGSLVLMGAELFAWWSVSIFALSLIILEIFFLSSTKEPKHGHDR